MIEISKIILISQICVQKKLRGTLIKDIREIKEIKEIREISKIIPISQICVQKIKVLN